MASYHPSYLVVSTETNANLTGFSGNLQNIHRIYPSSKNGPLPAGELRHIYQSHHNQLIVVSRYRGDESR